MSIQDSTYSTNYSIYDRRIEQFSRYRETVDRLVAYSQKLDEYLELSNKLGETLLKREINDRFNSA